MITITDSNILFSALYSPENKIGEIFSSKSQIQFLAPDYVIDEINEHSNEILFELNISKREFQERFSSLLNSIKIIKTAEISNAHLQKAIEIVKDIDPKDAAFVALHFHLGHKIWTGDKQLINGLLAKGYDICVTTKELKKMLYKKD